MNRIKLSLYIAIEVFLIIMARFLFLSTGRMDTLTSEAGLQQQAGAIIQNLYVFQALAVFIPFIVVMGFIIYEVAEHKKIKKLQSEKDTEANLSEQKEEEADTEQMRQEKEQQQKLEFENKKQNLHKCIESALKGKTAEDTKAVSETLLGCLADVYEITQAEIFVRNKTEEDDKLVLSATYAFYIPDEKVFEFQLGEGLIGQVAKAAEPLYLDELPQGYITVKSGLGSATPSHLLIVPWTQQEDNTFAVLEIASFKEFDKQDIEIIQGLSEKLRDFYV